jgi:hypothetical protein
MIKRNSPKKNLEFAYTSVKNERGLQHEIQNGVIGKKPHYKTVPCRIGFV